ncbi:hypothetical protein ACS0TY_005847 [Phlomoides rotata]
MRAVLARKPWHFDKNVVMLQELEKGSQPSTIDLTNAAFWVRIYDLPMAARNTGHMRNECDLIDGSKLMENLPNTKLPFGDWMRASPGKKTLVSMEANTPKRENTSMRRQLFEKFKESVTKDVANLSEEMGKGIKESAIHRQEEDTICE